METKPRGGMVNSLFKVTDYLSEHGAAVWVYSDIKQPGIRRSGVLWDNRPPRKGVDILVCNRGTGNGCLDVNARKRILWTHDLPHSGFIPNPKTIKGFAATVFMSRYAERVWRTFYRDIGKSAIIPNGVDRCLFYPRSPVEKDLDSLIYFCHPNRGLKRLPLIFDSVQAKIDRPLTMNAYSGKIRSMYPAETGNDDHLDTDWAINYDTSKETGFAIKDPLPTKEIAEEVGKAGIFVMPTAFPEICSNSVLQALACGTPVVTAGNLGSACEWVENGYNGMLTKFQCQDYMVFQMEMVRNCVEILKNKAFHSALCRQAAQTKILSWEEVGKQWMKLLKKVA